MTTSPQIHLFTASLWAPTSASMALTHSTGWKPRPLPAHPALPQTPEPVPFLSRLYYHNPLSLGYSDLLTPCQSSSKPRNSSAWLKRKAPRLLAIAGTWNVLSYPVLSLSCVWIVSASQVPFSLTFVASLHKRTAPEPRMLSTPKIDEAVCFKPNRHASYCLVCLSTIAVMEGSLFFIPSTPSPARLARGLRSKTCGRQSDPFRPGPWGLWALTRPATGIF